jgi:antitoxin (DNA-binding transcriptional repressor) of toxin-antitoxin stability system
VRQTVFGATPKTTRETCVLPEYFTPTELWPFLIFQLQRCQPYGLSKIKPFVLFPVLVPAPLARTTESGYSSGMSTISVSELKKKPTSQWLKSVGKDDLVITAKGRPVAMLLRIASASAESTRALVRSVRALQAQAALQQSAVASGASGLSLPDIDAEIAAARRARRRK